MSNCKKLWQQVFALSDSDNGYRVDADGNVTSIQAVIDQLEFLSDAFDAFEAKITEEGYRQAHTLDQLDSDARLFIRYSIDEDFTFLAPQLVGLVVLFRFYEYHPRRSPQENFTKSKDAAKTLLAQLLSQVEQFRANNAESIAKFPTLAMTWFTADFISQFETTFELLAANKIPPADLQQDFYTHAPHNTAAWILDIHNSVMGSSSNHTEWEVGLRTEAAWMSLDDYKTKRQAEWAEIKKYQFAIPNLKKDFGNYIKSNIEDFDFDMNEPYEETLEENLEKLPAL